MLNPQTQFIHIISDCCPEDKRNINRCRVYHGAQDPEQLAAHVMVRDENWKYIWNRFDIDELYDLNADPGEMKNVASDSDRRNRVASMRGQIVEMICHTGPGPYEWCLLEREKTE